jgi:hypothetical protein
MLRIETIFVSFPGVASVCMWKLAPMRKFVDLISFAVTCWIVDAMLYL